MSDLAVKIFDIIRIIEFAASGRKIEVGEFGPSGLSLGGRKVSCFNFADLVGIAGRTWSLNIGVTNFHRPFVVSQIPLTVLDYWFQRVVTISGEPAEFIVEEANDHDGRAVFHPFGRMLFIDKIEIDGDLEAFWNDWVIFKMYDHQWRA